MFLRLNPLALILLLVWSVSAVTQTAAPLAKAGVLDASHWDPARENLLLVGEWGFAWQQLLDARQRHTPQSPWFRMPSTWDSSGSAGWHYPGQGHASFLLQIENLPAGQEYAVFIPEVSTAFRLYANGRLISSAGQVGEKLDDVRAYSGNKMAVVGELNSGRVLLLLQVANYHHNSGGPWQTIQLGTREAINQQFYNGKVYDALIATLMVIMAALLTLEYLVDPKDRAGLWLGALAFALGIRIGITDNTAFYWLAGNEIPWSWHIRLAYLSMMISPVFFLAWIHNSFPLDLRRNTSLVLSLPYLLSALLCLLVPPLYFTQLLTLFSALIFFVVGLGSILLLQISWRRRPGSLLSLLGLMALGITVTHDLMLNNQLASGNPWIATGLLLFVLTQTSNFLRLRVLQRRRIEFLSTELAEANRELEHRVELRTRDLAEKAHALEQANSQLQVLANVDSLTGLLNRRAFIEQMQQLSELPVRVALLWIDIDHFKQINDTHGHAAGDQVLQRFGLLLREVGRDQDRIGRLGGEEFALLLLDCDRDGAVIYAQRLQQALTRLTFSDWPQLQGVTASIGIAIGRLGEDSWEELITRADEAMYDVKRAGRDSYRVG